MLRFTITCNAKSVKHNLQQYKKQFTAKADVYAVCQSSTSRVLEDK